MNDLKFNLFNLLLMEKNILGDPFYMLCISFPKRML